jgi:hypothetical protein
MNSHYLRGWRKPVHVETCLKTPKPEGGRKQLEGTEYVPQNGLAEALIFDCLRTRGGSTEMLGMMRRDDELLANGSDGVSQDCL